MTGLEELVANLEARIEELIAERDAAVEKLLEVQRENEILRGRFGHEAKS